MMFTFSLFVCWQLDVYVWQVGSINSVTSLTWDRGQFFMHSALQLMAGFRRVIDAGRQKAFGRVCCWLESQWHVCS
uniref:Secreted protein n=1 Tax=Setaria italica TaxID=4555 RepID=K4ANH4_SETIT